MAARSREAVDASAVRLVTIIAAAGSLASMFIVGSRQPSIVLMALFTVWVLSPYVGLVLLNARARTRPHSSRKVIQGSTMAIAILALARYVFVVLWPLKERPASTFLIVPFVSWIVLAAGAVIATVLARRN